MQVTEKPPLLLIINRYRLTLPSLARASGLRIDVVRAAAIYGAALSPDLAHQLIWGLNYLTKRHFSLNDVAIKTWEDHHDLIP